MRLLMFFEPPCGLSSLVIRYHCAICSHCLLKGLLVVQLCEIELRTEITFRVVQDVLLEMLMERFSHPRFSHPKLRCQSCHENICPPHLGFASKLQTSIAFQGKCQQGRKRS